ncbi:chaplin, partial [Streptomyces sp. NPDC058534]|uniref:chaplin n=1 Tax=Streptomyces sp. NPDC058534 TaxID=3346541 RepID=UPI003648D729
MRQTLSRGVFAAAAATGILSLSGTPALADSTAVAATEDSSGPLAGNNVSVPVSVPVNVCGNTIGVIGVLNRATGGSCDNVSYGHGSDRHSGGAEAVGTSEESSRLLAGNNVSVPVSAPVNVCGNTGDVVGVLNRATGGSCDNVSYGHGSDRHSGGAEAVG